MKKLEKLLDGIIKSGGKIDKETAEKLKHFENEFKAEKSKKRTDEIEFDNYPQEDLPENWKTLVSEAKVQHDKYGIVCTTFILPASWAKDFYNKVMELEFVEFYADKYMLWGSSITFGPVDRPVAGGDIRLWSNMV